MKQLLLKSTIFIISFCSYLALPAQTADPYQPDDNPPRSIPGMELVWSDEFAGSELNSNNWVYEKGFVRNQELQYYQASNVTVDKGLLVMTAKRDTVANSSYISGSTDWRYKSEFAYYTSGSIKSQKKKSFLFGVFEIRARIDTTKGSWPAIWTKGNDGQWPTCGEIDIMEFYISGGKQVFLANVIYGGSTSTVKYMGAKKDLAYFLAKDPDFVKKFHVWTEVWDETKISLYLDNELIYSRAVNLSANPAGTAVANGFLQPHYFTLNLAIGANGGDPANSKFPVKYEVDYVRVYQKMISATEETNENSKLFYSQHDKSLTIQTNTPCMQLIVTDTMGRRVINIKHPDTKTSLETIKSGIYLVSIYLNNGVRQVSKINVL